MDNNVDALKALYVALGGDADDVAEISLISDMIKAIATVVPASSALLPTVTAANDGDILKVVDGEWAAVTPEP